MTTITVRYAYCPKHATRHMVDERENHIANDTAELKAKGFFYLRHIGGGWYSYRIPRSLPLDWLMAQDPEPPEHYQELDPELF